MQSGKPRLLYKVNKLRVTNTNKVQESLKAFAKLLKRLEREGNTKWMINAINMAMAKLNKYGFNNAQIAKKFSFDPSSLKVEKKEAASAPKKTTAKKTTTAKKEEATA